MNTPNIRYYAKMVNTTRKGKKTPKYTITAQAGYYPPMNEIKGKDGKVSMYLQATLEDLRDKVIDEQVERIKEIALPSSL